MAGDGTTSYDMEYKHMEDDAWYSVEVVLSPEEDDGEEEETLTVKFQGFGENEVVKYTGRLFRTMAEVDNLLKRFRPMSKQVQDWECFKVVQGMKVCAAQSVRNDDLRFYDAYVEAVHTQPHSSANGEDQCLCSFVLYWLHGPNRNTLTLGNIADICIIQAASRVDPRILSFSKLAKEKIQIASSKSIRASQPYISNQKSSSDSRCQENETETGYGMECKAKGLSFQGRFDRYVEVRDDDEDFGGDDSVKFEGHHFLVIDNLENDLSPSSIRQFIQKHTFISPEAYIFPSRASVPYASGAIMLDSKMKLEKIYEFLINPEHLIVSSRGRPWVISNKVLSHGTFGTTHGSLAIDCKDEFEKYNDDRELNVVHSGTEGYKTAKRLWDLFMDFVDHEQLLHKRFALEETRIQMSSQ